MSQLAQCNLPVENVCWKKGVKKSIAGKKNLLTEECAVETNQLGEGVTNVGK